MYHLNFCITDKCNQNCIHCFVNPNQCNFNGLEENFIIGLCEKAFRFGLKSVHIFGGEPFLRPDLKNICEKLNELKINISIATNGHFLNPEQVEWIEKFNIFLTISLHGTEKIHDEIANMQGSFKTTLNNIKYLLNKKIKFAITTCVNKLNMESYPSLLQELTKIGIKNFIILYFSPIGRGMELIDYIISNEEWEQFIFDVQRFKWKLDPEIEISFEPSIFNRKYINLFTYRQQWASCQINYKNNFVIDANGDVYPCILLLRDKRYLLGNVLKSDIIEIYNKDLTLSINSAYDIPNTCLNCNLFDLCKSGCIAYKGKGNIDFRCNPQNKNYALLCPLFTKILY